jgi:hypothetical protein
MQLPVVQYCYNVVILHLYDTATYETPENIVSGNLLRNFYTLLRWICSVTLYSQ